MLSASFTSKLCKGTKKGKETKLEIRDRLQDLHSGSTKAGGKNGYKRAPFCPIFPSP